jgi:hypothetical protein
VSKAKERINSEAYKVNGRIGALYRFYCGLQGNRLVILVCLVYLVCLVFLIDETNQINQTNQIDQINPQVLGLSG